MAKHAPACPMFRYPDRGECSCGAARRPNAPANPSPETLATLVQQWEAEALDPNRSDPARVTSQRHARELQAALAAVRAPVEAPDSLRADAQTIYDTFSRDEAQGYRSRDRQFAIDLLKRHFEPPAVPPTPEPEQEPKL